MRVQSYDRLGTALSVVGLVVAGYLTLLHYDTSVPLVCGQGSFIDCASVLSSPSSMVLGVPVAAWGILWFVVALVLSMMTSRRPAGGGATRLRAAALGWTLVGTGSVLWLVYQEIGVIGKICAWCTVVHVLILALLVVHVRALEAAKST